MMTEKATTDNKIPVKTMVGYVPCYKRQYVLPITSAIQSKEPWKWPPPERPDYECLDRILNSTTLTTQCVAHQDILECGENIHADLTADLKGRISEIEHLQQNFTNIVAQEVKKIKGEMEERYKKLLTEYLNKQQDNMSDKWAHKLTTMLELEKEKIERLNVEWQLRMEDALQKQRDELEAEHRRKLAEALKNAQKQHIDDIDQRVADALKKQLDELEGTFRDRLDRKVAEMNALHKKQMDELRAELTKKHEAEMNQLKAKWLKMCERYKQLLEFSRNVERDYMLLEDDFKRFINNVKGAGGHFGSEYLIRSKQHGLIVMPSEKPTISADKMPDFEGVKKQTEARQLSFTELSASFADQAFWPDSKFSIKDQFERPRTEAAKLAPFGKSDPGNLIPVKLVRPLDSDEIGNVFLPVRMPEQNGAAFVLTLNDF